MIIGRAIPASMYKPKKLVRRIERKGRNHVRGREDADGLPVGLHKESCLQEDAAKDGDWPAMRDAGRMATTRHRGPRWAVQLFSPECSVEPMTSSARWLWGRRAGRPTSATQDERTKTRMYSSCDDTIK